MFSFQWNRQILLETIAFLFGALGILYITITETFLAYVTPRMEPFLYFMAFVLLLWALTNIPYLTKRSYKNYYFHTLILIIPTMFLFMPTPAIPGTHQIGNVQKGVATSISEGSHRALSRVKKAVGIDPTEEPTVEQQEVEAAMRAPANADATKDDVSRYGALPVDPEPTKKYGSTGDASARADASERTLADGATEDDDIGGFGGGSSASSVTVTQSDKAVTSHGGTIVITSNNYYRKIMDIMTHPDQYIGKTVVITGYVIRDHSYYSQGDFFLGRMAMTCCIADIAPVGFPVFYSGGSQYADETWLTVEGTVRKADYHGMTQAALDVTKVSLATPIKGYVYP